MRYTPDNPIGERSAEMAVQIRIVRVRHSSTTMPARRRETGTTNTRAGRQSASGPEIGSRLTRNRASNLAGHLIQISANAYIHFPVISRASYRRLRRTIGMSRSEDMSAS
jgi:hypothetical protein